MISLSSIKSPRSQASIRLHSGSIPIDKASMGWRDDSLSISRNFHSVKWAFGISNGRDSIDKAGRLAVNFTQPTIWSQPAATSGVPKGLFQPRFSRLLFFSEEKEWRTALPKHLGINSEELSFRELRGTIVPYVEMKFAPLKPDPPYQLPIVEIIQGPLRDPLLGEKSLRMLLKKLGYTSVEIRRSKVPIRF